MSTLELTAGQLERFKSAAQRSLIPEEFTVASFKTSIQTEADFMAGWVRRPTSYFWRELGYRLIERDFPTETEAKYTIFYGNTLSMIKMWQANQRWFDSMAKAMPQIRANLQIFAEVLKERGWDQEYTLRSMRGLDLAESDDFGTSFLRAKKLDRDFTRVETQLPKLKDGALIWCHQTVRLEGFASPGSFRDFPKLESPSILDQPMLVKIEGYPTLVEIERAPQTLEDYFQDPAKIDRIKQIARF